MAKIPVIKPSQAVDLMKEMHSQKPALIHIEYNKMTGLIHFKIEGFNLGEEKMIVKVLEVAAKHVGRPEFQTELVKSAMNQEKEAKMKEKGIYGA